MRHGPTRCPWTAILLVAACTGADTLELPIMTIALPAPELGEPAFEPSVAIDRDRPERIVVGSHYGVGYNRGGRRIWSWHSRDEGRNWRGAELPLPNVKATLAADVVAGFQYDGTALLAFLFADSTFRGGLAVARSDQASLEFGPAILAVPDRLDQGQGAVDKPWLAIDRNPTSPHRGTAYLTLHLNRPLPDRTVESTLWISSSRNGGTEWTEPLLVAEDFGGQVAVRRDGAVDVIYGERSGRTFRHRGSHDGGRTFGPPAVILTAEPSFELDLPSIVATEGGTVALCWAEDSAAVTTTRRVRCMAGSETTGWSTPVVLEGGHAGRAAVGLPAMAAGASGVWALAYRSDSVHTDVVLYRSTDEGKSYREYEVLASRPFGSDRICLAPGGPCRRAPADSGIFFPGDYLGLDTARNRVVAAYVLPDGELSAGRPTVHVSVVRVTAR